MRKVISSLLVGSMLLTATNSYKTESFDVNEKSIVSYDYEWIEGEDGINYPVTADNVEWNDFQSHEEMVEVCNMPDELLAGLSTDELVNLMLEYPLLGDLFLYDDISVGFETLAENSNILTELLEREDGARKLLEAYCRFEIIEETELPEEVVSAEEPYSSKVIDVASDAKYEDIIEKESENIIQDIFLETVLVQEQVIQNLEAEEIEILAEEAAEKVEAKENSDIYSAYENTIYDVAEDTNTIDMLGECETVQKGDMNSVYGNDTYTTVKTPKGSKVSVVKRTFNGAEAASAYNYTVQHYPNAKIVAGATTNYNCHSYAWYKQSTSNIYWMNNPGKYMSDGSYKRVGTTPTAKKQKVCYIQYPLTSPYIHSGIVYSISGSTIKIKSKWGAGPLVIHNVNYSPYSGTPIYYK